MKVEILPAVTWCDDCKQEYETVAHGRICPYCSSERTWLLKGNELNIKEVEVI
ncbi:MAG: hydrogenase maturation nickel metallochaperone HypA [Oscillospiraceae bacterium]|nr:hydrogenase maturation nickel metallochaperone HypA [Oscillospiraceae bacterium]